MGQGPSAKAGDGDRSKAGMTAGRRASLKMQVELPDGGRLGPGKVRLLELIETEGSLSRAAETMGISYRRAWLFVQQINAAFDRPAIATPKHGRGGAAAKLTEFGEELIRRYRGLESAAQAEAAQILRWMDRHRGES